jgi:hypothetical protein
MKEYHVLVVVVATVVVLAVVMVDQFRSMME